MLDKISQLSDLGEWGKDKFPQEGKTNSQQIQSHNRLTRKELFTALLRTGIDFGRIDDISTNKLHGMYLGEKVDFRLRREVGTASTDSPKTLYPSSSYLQGEWEVGQVPVQIKESIPLTRMMTQKLRQKTVNNSE